MPALERTVRVIATRLDEIAGTVAAESLELTAGLRTIGDHARQITAIASDLEEAAQQVDEGLNEQLRLVTAERARLADNRPALDALAASADIIETMSARIRDIAARSRMLSLNARIEAARTDAGNGFVAVAAAMGDLSAQTRTTTDDIDGEAHQIGRNVAVASGIIQLGMEIADRQHTMIHAVAATSEQQRGTAGALRRLTAETVERVDDAAITIGRVSSAASIVGLLARQLVRVFPPTEASNLTEAAT